MANLNDYKKIIHKFYFSDMTISNGHIYFKFPYYKNTFWSSYTINCKETNNIKANIQIRTTDGYIYDLQKYENKTTGYEYSCDWSFPSIDTTGKDYGIYLKITLPSDYHPQTFYLDIFLYGYESLYPISKYYILLSDYNYEFLITKINTTGQLDDSLESGVIHHIDHTDYIKDIITESIEIMPN